MSGYSERSPELARELGEKAARNLERSGKVVHRSDVTGRYVVTSPRAKSSVKKKTER